MSLHSTFALTATQVPDLPDMASYGLSGKEMLSLCIGQYIQNYEHKGVIVQNGLLIKGVLTKSHLAAGARVSMFHHVHLHMYVAILHLR